MKNQRTYVTVRGAVFGVAIMGITGALVGCATPAVETGTTAMTNAVFGITFDASAPKDEAISVSPGEGDAWIHSAEDGSSTIVWTADRPFGIKFVQIDDQTKKPRKKFGPKQKDDWNAADCSTPTSCKLVLELDPGTPPSNRKKEIRGAKYIVAAPSGCIDEPTRSANCMWQDPIIIVRY